MVGTTQANAIDAQRKGRRPTKAAA
jgi:hypothetical protein